ncbi:MULTISPECIES: hypothetical protein [unclassified Colwellia]|uniref:hypothetical protein n=1 Tax=unclassified Colwellia TaxID=196834 RepID=UPI0015F4E5E6|nr:MULTISPECIES: hypothetical protein [unclassified Colwellia]MBA6233994.1 hypothetical protein [Colwellia sp. MB02u-7]MBA6236942.1 hypothetical protein [Colwellia sp. MB02u-11]MBA6256115.1 hypothetical protein [Colwellia sp. MB3u-28]MBA6259346.1 hypothetical protein [Colwellia sp. MB3u-41]MBA6300668.1 hypothetical protein [Colwellia sp. MB3u-22]
MLEQLAAFYQSSAVDKHRLFVATTNRVTKVYPKDNYVKTFIETLNKKPKQGLDFDLVTFGADENHHTMPILSFIRAYVLFLMVI